MIYFDRIGQLNLISVDLANRSRHKNHVAGAYSQLVQSKKNKYYNKDQFIHPCRINESLFIQFEIDGSLETNRLDNVSIYNIS